MGDITWSRHTGGYLYRKVNGRIVYQHREAWEAAHGPVPPGHYVHHLDGNPANNDLANLALVPRTDHRALHEAARPAVVVPCTVCGAPLTRRRSWPPAVCKPCQYRRADRKRTSPRTCRACGRVFSSIRGNYCSQHCVNVGARWAGPRL